MGIPIWREPPSREPSPSRDPAIVRRSAIRRRPRPARGTSSSSIYTRPQIRSSQTLFDLIHSDYAHQESANSARDRSLWSDSNNAPSPSSSSEAASLPPGRSSLITLPDPEVSVSAGPGGSGLRRVRSPLPSLSSRGEMLAPRFLTAFQDRYLEEVRRARGGGGGGGGGEGVSASSSSSRRSEDPESDRVYDDQTRRMRASLNTNSARWTGEYDAGGFMIRGPAEPGAGERSAAALIDEVRSSRNSARFFSERQEHDENDGVGRREVGGLGGGLGSGHHSSSSSSRRWFDVDGLGDRERSLSPEWETFANDLGFQAACDLWESDSDGGGGGGPGGGGGGPGGGPGGGGDIPAGILAASAALASVNTAGTLYGNEGRRQRLRRLTSMLSTGHGVGGGHFIV